MTNQREDLIQVLYGKAVNWPEDFLLKRGEHGFEWDQGRFKIGDGITPYADLDYYVPESRVRELIQDAIEDLPSSSDGGISSVALTTHINSEMPHPSYDDGSSFALLYHNAKVG